MAKTTTKHCCEMVSWECVWKKKTPWKYQSVME